MKIDWYLQPGTGLASFTDASPEEEGLGGAEATVVYMTREWAKMGHEVTVYGAADTPSYGHGVKYEQAEMFSPTSERDVFILHRCPALPITMKRINAKVKIFFSCDQGTVGNWTTEIYPYIDQIFTISEYHKQYLYLFQNAKKRDSKTGRPLMYVTDLGIVKKDYDKKVNKISGKMIYCSQPERGLVYALEFFKEVKARVPHAELVVTADHRLWGKPYTGVSPILMGMAKGTEGVTYLGKIPRKELIQHQLESEIMFYPCVYDENFCISAAECQAAGAVPVTTSMGAMKTTVRHGETGRVLESNPLDPNYRVHFVNTVVELLDNQAERQRLMVNGINRAFLDFDWKIVATKWINQFEKIKGEKNV